MKKIAILTSGGDAPGMNACIRACVRSALNMGIEVYGIDRGYSGLVNNDIVKMDTHSVCDIIHRGGTILKSARCLDFKLPETRKIAADNLKNLGIEGLVVIGGDGSFRGARDLANIGLPVVGIPATIDNDIGCTDYTIGFDTACNTVIDAIDKIKDTAYSHERCSVVEVMGRNAGYIALHCGIADGAEAVVLPEKNFDLNKDIIKPILECRNNGKHHYIVIIAEGVGNTMEVAQEIRDITGISTTATILGHLQRGGSPTVQDRLMASLMGCKATEIMKNGGESSVVCSIAGNIRSIEINEALDIKKEIDPGMIETSKILSLFKTE